MSNHISFQEVQIKCGFSHHEPFAALLGMALGKTAKEQEGRTSSSMSQRLWLLLRLPHEPQIKEILWYWTQHGITQTERVNLLERIAPGYFHGDELIKWRLSMRSRHPHHYA